MRSQPQRRIEASRILSGGGPTEGQRVLFCPHAELTPPDRIFLPGTFHWHRFVPAETIEDTRTDETFTVEWFAVCEACKTTFPDPSKALSQDAEWLGESPNITRVV